MFAALKQDGTIDYLIAAIPPPIEPPDPLPEGYVPPPVIEYREVVNGAQPTLSSTFSRVDERPLSEWTVTPTQVIREFIEVIRPLTTVKGMKKAFLALATRAEHDGGITAGGFTFASDVLPDMLACARIAEMSTRMGNQTQNINFVLADNTIQPVQAKDALTLVMAYCVEHHRRRVAMANKLRTVAQATTIADIETIT